VYLFPFRGTALGSIFISYRRSDSAGEAGRLSDDLTARFGAERVFMDVDAIQPGKDFRKAIRENVGGCSLLLAMIGPEWLETKSTSGTRRLDGESDYVRLEIATALGRDIPVVPILIRNARMPKADQLPDDIRELAYRNSVELTHARWRSDVQVLLQSLAPYLDPSPAAGPTQTVAPVTAQQVIAPPALAPGAAFDTALVNRVTHELACHIGPIAEVVVKRATKRCASLPDLCNLVAQEIESTSERARFLAACRK
jgi:TIR domain